MDSGSLQSVDGKSDELHRYRILGDVVQTQMVRTQMAYIWVLPNLPSVITVAANSMLLEMLCHCPQQLELPPAAQTSCYTHDDSNAGNTHLPASASVINLCPCECKGQCIQPTSHTGQKIVDLANAATAGLSEAQLAYQEGLQRAAPFLIMAARQSHPGTIIQHPYEHCLTVCDGLCTCTETSQAVLILKVGTTDEGDVTSPGVTKCAGP